MGFYLSIILGVVSRLIPHPANLTPLGALVFQNSRKSSLWKGIGVVIITMVVTDLFLGFSFSSLFVYAGFVCYALFARIKKLNPVAAVLMGSVAFFIISNFGVWLGPWYAHTLEGLWRCMVNALPFYRNTLIGDLAFITIISVAQSIAERFNLKLRITEALGRSTNRIFQKPKPI